MTIDYNEGADRYLHNLSDAKLRGQLRAKHCNPTWAARVQAELARRTARVQAELARRTAHA